MRSEDCRVGGSILLPKFIYVLAAVLFISAEAPFAAPEDLSGYWEPLIMEDFILRTQGVKKGDYNGIELNDLARTAADHFKPDAGKDELLLDKCGPHGAPRVMFTATRLHITQNDREITMELEAEGQIRRFYLDSRDWPGGELQWQGHSIAYEEGDGLLTVITRHLRPGLLRSNGVPYSEEAVLTEHYTRHGDYFTVIQAVEDPKYLQAPFITSTSFHRISKPDDWRMGSCR
ncbi:MAG: hypothetical protein HW386_960 [Gammaproteobacteria bacterium]|nr:hypothetical protein [Gammaproteobacteria bacterium]